MHQHQHHPQHYHHRQLYHQLIRSQQMTKLSSDWSVILQMIKLSSDWSGILSFPRDNTIWCWCSSPCTIPQSVGQCDHNDSWFVGDDDSDCVGDGENFTQRLYLFKKNFFLLLERSGGLYKFWLEWLNDDDNDGDFAAAGCTAPPWRFLKCCQFLPNL